MKYRRSISRFRAVSLYGMWGLLIALLPGLDPAGKCLEENLRDDVFLDPLSLGSGEWGLERDMCPTGFKLPLPLPALVSPETLLASLSDLLPSFSPKVVKHTWDPALDPGSLLACPSYPCKCKTAIILGPCGDSKWVPMSPLQHLSASPAPCHFPAYLDPGTAPGTEPERSKPGRWAAWRRWPWLHPAGRRGTHTTSRCAGGLACWREGRRRAGAACVPAWAGPAGRALCQWSAGQAAPTIASETRSLATDACDACATEDHPGLWGRWGPAGFQLPREGRGWHHLGGKGWRPRKG